MAALTHIVFIAAFLCLSTASYYPSNSLKSQSPRSVAANVLREYKETGSILSRPVVNEKDSLLVTHGIVAQQISDLDYNKQAIKVSFILSLRWKDPFLAWDVKENKNEVESIRVWPEEIFMPDIKPFNGASKEDYFFPSQAVVSHTGEVTYAPMLKQKFACNIPKPNSRKEFNCTMKFGSWTYDASKIDLQLQDNKVETSYYMKHPMWTLVGTSAVRHEIKYSEDLPTYVDLTYTLTLKYN